MSAKDLLSDIALDNSGKAVLPDSMLEAIEKIPVIASSGGANTDSCNYTDNGNCSNTGNCTGSENVECSNVEFCGDTQNGSCPSSVYAPGPGGA